VEVKGRKNPVAMKKIECFRNEYGAKVILADGDYFKRKKILV
jgi:hypothetical protein